MYEIIPDTLASHGIGDNYLVQPANEAIHEQVLFHKGPNNSKRGWRILDARIIRDDYLTDEEAEDTYAYEYLIDYGVRMIKDKGWRVVVCCGAGQSRSNAIALGILVKYFNMDFYQAMELIREKVPIQWIHPTHIAVLKKIFGVTLP